MSHGSRSLLAWSMGESGQRALPDCVRAVVDGRLIVVTGGSRGIGAVTATRLASVGAHLVLVARTAADLNTVCARLRAGGAVADSIVVDLRDSEAARRAGDQILSEFGVPDILISNAGHSIRRPLVDYTDRFHDIERTAGVNYLGAVSFVLPILREMSERGSGHLISVSTTSVDLPLPSWSAYSASKGAFEAWLSAVTPELRADGIACSSIHLPRVATQMSEPTRGRYPVPELTVDEAASILCRVILHRPRLISPWWSRAAGALHAMVPSASDAILTMLLRHGISL